jgi:ribose transport system permease protein
MTNSTGQLSVEAGIAPVAPSLHRRRRGTLWRSRFSYVAFAASFLVLLIVANALVNPVAFSASQILTTIGLASPLVFAAMAVTPAILVGGGGIDLSVGPLMSLVGAFIVVGVIQDLGITTPPVVISVALATGIVSGLLTGFLVAVLRLQPIVATLGTYLAYGGVTLIIAPQPTGSVPPWLADMAQGGSLPALVVVFVAWWLFTRTPLYEALMATGGDDRAAFVAGIPVTRVRITAYVLSGVLASIAGLSLAALLGSVDPNAGAQYTLIGIASVALGGVSLGGGRGGMVGAVVGALDIFLIDNVLTYYNISSFLEQVVYGAILVAAVCINRIVAARIGAPR